MKDFFKKIKSIIKFNNREVISNEKIYSNLIKDNQTWVNSIIFSFISIFTTLFIFSILTKIDEVVSARGEIQTVGAERPIKSPLNGEIKEIHVKEGDTVKKDQILILLNSYEYTNLLQTLKYNEEILKTKLNHNLELLKKFEKAYKEGIITVQELNNVLRIRNQILIEINENKSKILEQKRLIEKTKILSPESGKVFNLIPNSSGYVTTYNENLLFIVPQKFIEAKIFVANSDIGFIDVNMPVKIRIDTYPFTEFGHIEGKISRIGAESLPPDNNNRFSRFPVIVNLNEKYLLKDNQKYSLLTGQSISANIILRKKRLITVVSDLFGKSIDSLKKIRTRG